MNVKVNTLSVNLQIGNKIKLKFTVKNVKDEAEDGNYYFI